MITINIKKATKCNGEYSLYLTFPYDLNIINAVREMPTRYWLNNTKEWELPFSKLQVILNKFQAYQINIIDKDGYLVFSQEEKKVNLEYKFKTKPFAHQITGVEYGLTHDKWLLGDEQGCVSGETLVQIKEPGKAATRKIKTKYLKTLLEKEPNIKIKSLVNGRFVYMPIKKVLDKGIQETIEITLENTSIQCTPDHLIYTKNGWIEAEKLNVNDNVFTNGTQVCPLCGNTQNLISYKYSKFNGYCKPCMYKHRKGTKYTNITKKLDKNGYVRLFGVNTRKMPNYNKMYGAGIYEHHQVWYENTGYIVDTTKEVVHHKNGVKSDNRFENLQLMSIFEHTKLHSDVNTNNLYQFNKNLDYIIRNGTKITLVPQLQKVKNISYAGEQQVWDIVIDDDNIHNFICNNIVVHNCGKTKTIIDIACAKKEYFKFKHCLIVCGVNGLKWNWRNEIAVHSNETSHIIGQKIKNNKVTIGSNKDKLEDLKHLPDDYFIITNVESLRDEEIVAELVNLCKSGEISMIACDEIHKVSNPSSQQGKGLLKLKSKIMVAMTGTPLMNTPLDLYTIFKWLGYESHSFYSFKQYYCEMGGFGGYQIVGWRHLDELQEQLNSIMLRRLKEDVLDLPEKLFVDEYVEMGAKQQKIYNEVTAEIQPNIDKIKTSNNPLAELIRLRQATGYTGVLSSTVKESAKIDRLEEIVDETIANGKKIVIYSNWTFMTDAIQERLCSKYRLLVITGNVNDKTRQEYIDTFQTNDDYKIILGTVGALGTGVTITKATVVCFVDQPWTYAYYSQAVDRCHRIGQTSNVTIYNLLTKNTIDERIWSIVKKKCTMSKAIVDQEFDISDNDKLVDYLLS